MHSYSDGFCRTSYTHVILGAVSLFIEIALVIALLPFIPIVPVPHGFGAISRVVLLILVAFPALFVLVECLFTEWVWRWFGIAQLAGIHDFRGTYQECTENGEPVADPSTLSIKQSWNSIEISLEKANDGVLKSLTAAIIRDRIRNGDIELVYTFFSFGSNTGKERENARYGTAMLAVKNGRLLGGDFFTESANANSLRRWFKKKS